MLAWKSQHQKKNDMACSIPEDAFALIIGAMKCGTSSLYSYLQAHPQICPAIIKEPEFFSEHQDHGVQTDDYRKLWSFDPAIHKYAMEASSGYTKYPSEPNVPEKIFNYGIRPKFIYIIRNPYDRIASHYSFMRYDETGSMDPDDEHLVNTSNYYLQLQQYTKYFPRENILILDFDEMTTSPTVVLEKTYRFLNVAPGHYPDDYSIKNVGRVEAKFLRKFETTKVSGLFRMASGPVRRLRARIVERRGLSKKRLLTEEEKTFVRHELQEDMANLYHSYGFDVRKWGFDI